MLQAIRTGSAADTSALTVKLLNQGVAPQSIFDALFDGAGELLMQAPGILSLHAMTFTNAIHYAWHRAQSDETRRLLLLQNAAFLPLFRGDRADKGIHIDTLEPLAPTATGRRSRGGNLRRHQQGPPRRRAQDARLAQGRTRSAQALRRLPRAG